MATEFNLIHFARPIVFFLNPVANIHLLIRHRYKKLYRDPISGEETVLQDYIVSEQPLPVIQIPSNARDLPLLCNYFLKTALLSFDLDTPLLEYLHKLVIEACVYLSNCWLGFSIFATVEAVNVEVVETEPAEMATKRLVSRLVIEKLQKQRLDVDAKKKVEGCCAVCLEDLLMDDEDEDEGKKMILAMPCSHLFHESCIFQWLEEDCSCPVCRRKVELEPADFEFSPVFVN